MDESRQQFERYIKLRGMSAMKRDGAYVESATRFAFDIWKASRAAIEIELPQKYEITEMSGNPWESYRCMEECEDGYHVRVEDIVANIESAGLKVKK